MKTSLRSLLVCIPAACFLLSPVAARAESLDDIRARQEKVQAVAKKVMGSVVAIVSADDKKPGSGSGVIVSKDGLILTAAHVTAATGNDLTIIFPDGRRVKGTALGKNRTTDAGMARITEPGEYPAAEIGSSDHLHLGDWVVAMGHPGGFDFERMPPVRLGRIWRRDLDGAMFTSCPLIGGDSGGPLFDLDGKVVGINSSIHGKVDMNRHVAVDTLRADWDKLMKDRTWGSPIFNAEPEDRPVTGTLLDRESEGGVKVLEVYDDLPGAKAGLKTGDLIVKFDGVDVDNFHLLQRLLGKKSAGDKVPLTVKRGDESVATEIELASRPKIGEEPEEEREGPSEPKVEEPTGPQPWFGASVEDTGGDGARIAEVTPDSPAAKAGLQTGDLIRGLNDQPITGPTAAGDLIGGLKPGDKLTVKLKRGDTELSLDLTLLEKK